MKILEKTIAYSPPLLYSKIDGIKSIDGTEAEGWLISIGGTPKEMMSRSPEFTYKRLIAASKMAEKLGAEIMGLGAFTKVVGDAGVTVAKHSPIPITTGNSYSASAALWAASEAMKKMDLVDIPKGKEKLKAKSMVIGATGAIGSVSSKLLSMVFDEVILCGRNTEKLNKISKYLDEIGVIVDIEGVGRIGGGEKVFYDSKTKKFPHITIIGVRPEIWPGIEGLKPLGSPEDIVPKIFDETVVDEWINITADDAKNWTNSVARKGYFVGQSSGSYLAATAKLLENINSGNVVTIFNDIGERYFSSGLWS